VREVPTTDLRGELLNHLVGAQQYGRQKRDAERLWGLFLCWHIDLCRGGPVLNRPAPRRRLMIATREISGDQRDEFRTFSGGEQLAAGTCVAGPPGHSRVLEAFRHHTAAIGELGHDLFVQPDVHLGRAVEAACVAKLLRKLLAGGET
jgi:hypothetical protein